MRVKSAIAGIVTLSLLLCGAAFRTNKSGVITGVVTDSAGAVMPGANATFGATVQQSTLDSAASAPLKLSLGQLLDSAATFGVFTQDAYDARQIEFVLRFRF